jgi:hypothetical protein
MTHFFAHAMPEEEPIIVPPYRLLVPLQFMQMLELHFLLETSNPLMRRPMPALPLSTPLGCP